MKFILSTKGFNDIIDITSKVSEAVKMAGKKDGICFISCSGSTCGITTNESEPGIIEDLKRVLEKIAPINNNYQHCKKWGDCNGYAHIRSAFIQPLLTVPIEEGKLALGQWQQILFIDFDNRPRERGISVKIISS